MELPNTEAMSIEEKIWFARAIAGMIVADGRVELVEEGRVGPRREHG